MKRLISALISAALIIGVSVCPPGSSEHSAFKDTITAEASSEIVTLKVKGTENYDSAYKVLELINKKRKSLGIAELTMDKQLLDAAMQRASEVSVYYSHTRPNGMSCDSIAPRFFFSFAENIAINFNTADAVVDAWLNSTDHYNNIVSSGLKSIGIGCYTDSSGITSWVQVFDSETPNDPETSGTVEKSHEIEILKSNLTFSAYAGEEFTENGKPCCQIGIPLVNKTFPFSYPEAEPSSFTFTSFDTSIATVDSTGKVTGVKTGDTVIRAALTSSPDLYYDVAVSFYVPEPIGPTVTHHDMKVSQYSLGDVNGDEYINSIDSSLVLTEYASTSTGNPVSFTSKQKYAAEINSDSSINSVDASMILSYYAYTATGGNITIQEYFDL